MPVPYSMLWTMGVWRVCNMKKLLGSAGFIILLAVGIVAVYLISTKKEIIDSELGVMYGQIVEAKSTEIMKSPITMPDGTLIYQGYEENYKTIIEFEIGYRHTFLAEKFSLIAKEKKGSL
jgi:hypothetical protein